MVFERNCPNCGKVMNYSTKQHCLDANESNTLCKDCKKQVTSTVEFKRNCPECGKEVIHKNKRSCDKAIKDKSLCPKCRCNTEGFKKGVQKSIESHQTEEFKNKMSSIAMEGWNNEDIRERRTKAIKLGWSKLFDKDK